MEKLYNFRSHVVVNISEKFDYLPISYINIFEILIYNNINIALPTISNNNKYKHVIIIISRVIEEIHTWIYFLGGFFHIKSAREARKDEMD